MRIENAVLAIAVSAWSMIGVVVVARGQAGPSAEAASAQAGAMDMGPGFVARALSPSALPNIAGVPAKPTPGGVVVVNIDGAKVQLDSAGRPTVNGNDLKAAIAASAGSGVKADQIELNEDEHGRVVLTLLGEDKLANAFNENENVEAFGLVELLFVGMVILLIIGGAYRSWHN